MKSAISSLIRDLAPQVLGITYRHFRDFSAAEDAVQEALLAAATQWPETGTPENPCAWLVRVAGRRFVDQARSERARRDREESSARDHLSDQPSTEEKFVEHANRDDTLDLLFMCCHPALSSPSAIALTLRAIGGLTTLEIANAFFVPEKTMAQRITRAKQTIQRSMTAGETFERLTPEHFHARLGVVQKIVYLVFNEGYVASAGVDLTRPDLSAEALRLARLLSRAAPEDAECTGLLALLILTEARRPARTGAAGELIALDEQDRSLWDRALIDEGVALLSAVLPRGSIGPYQLQAAIAAVHDEAPRAEDTDWPEILGLYALLVRMNQNPMTALSHAIATAMVHGPSAGLERLDVLAEDRRLSSHRLDAARAHLLERMGDLNEAHATYQRAAEGATSVAERNYLTMRAARLKSPPAS